MKKKTVRDIDLKNKKVLMRVDFNVNLLDDLTVGDDTRIKQAVPTIEYLLDQGCSVILTSHLGRPEPGKREKETSLNLVLDKLSKFVGQKVTFVEDFTKDASQVKKLKPGQVALLENIRYYEGESINDPKFAKQLADLAEVFVSDCFGTAHRVHASVVGVTEYLPSVAGLLLERECDVILDTIKKPKSPFVAIIGGAKAETKITLIDRLLELADTLLVGGGVANTFFKSWGLSTGESLVDHEMVELSKAIIWKASRENTALKLPLDVVLGNIDKKDFSAEVASYEKIPAKMQALDIGPKTQAEFGAEIAKAKTLIWNGPMGFYEEPAYRRGTEFIYHSVSGNKDAVSIVGGGDTISSIQHEEYLSGITHISTGGGAMLELIEKGHLPGIDALNDK